MESSAKTWLQFHFYHWALTRVHFKLSGEANSWRIETMRVNFSSNYTIHFQIHWWWLMIKAFPPKAPSVSCSSTDWWDKTLVWDGGRPKLFTEPCMNDRVRPLKASTENVRLRADLNHRTRLSWCLVFTELERWKQTTWEPKPKIPQSFRRWINDVNVALKRKGKSITTVEP